MTGVQGPSEIVELVFYFFFFNIKINWKSEMLSCYNQGSRYYRINDIDLALN